MVHVFVDIGKTNAETEHFEQVKRVIPAMLYPTAFKKVFAVKIDASNVLVIFIPEILQLFHQFRRDDLVCVEANNPWSGHRKILQSKIPLFGMIFELVIKESCPVLTADRQR